ncbi:MAG TPA: alpha/beta fold hydrolase [Dokdonella sp.]|uniref:alpha/beta fold hydrolase n=1 Tax=Dokdonella sp. TaxID=2291710 RepID=UPI002D7E80D6|nr:alpha/beta fold hydrolase [Dokdonella sp.]HET9031811.1 alpha/beta fold hydrolase [Dokdonella sp.]
MAVTQINQAQSEGDCPSPQREVLRLREFNLACGLKLGNAALAWQSWGPHLAPVVIVLGGISADRDIGDWWSAQCGPGRALDPRRQRLVSIDWIGGSDASSGPRNDEDFVPIDSLDQAHAILQLLNHLGLAQIDAVIGASYGGCVGQHLASLLGNRLGRLIVIGAAHRASPWALALRTLQRAGVESARTPEDRRCALARARQLAVLGYRTPAELEDRFGECDPTIGVLGWLAAHGDRFVSRFSAASFLCLSRSLDHHQSEPETIRATTTVVAIAEDLLVPLSLANELVRRIGRDAGLATISSPYGHDAFIKEEARISSIIQSSLDVEIAA